MLNLLEAVRNARLLPAVCLCAAALTGCGPSAPTCENLSGAWRDAETGDRYQITAAGGGGFEMVAMFDTAGHAGGVWRAPVVYDLSRTPSGIRGRQSQRREKPGQFCTVRRPVEGSCERGRLTLRVQKAGKLDWQSCRAAPAGGADALVLRPD